MIQAQGTTTASFPDQPGQRGEAARSRAAIRHPAVGRRLTGMLGIPTPSEHARAACSAPHGGWIRPHGQVFGSLTWNPLDPLKIDLGGTLEHHDYKAAGCSAPPCVQLRPRRGLGPAPVHGTAYRPQPDGSRAGTDRPRGRHDPAYRLPCLRPAAERAHALRRSGLCRAAAFVRTRLRCACLSRNYYRRFIDDKSCVFGECPRPSRPTMFRSTRQRASISSTSTTSHDRCRFPLTGANRAGAGAVPVPGLHPVSTMASPTATATSRTAHRVRPPRCC